MSKKYVSMLLAQVGNKGFTRKIYDCIYDGKLTSLEYHKYFFKRGMSITATSAKQLIEGRKITLEDYFKYYVVDYKNLQHYLGEDCSKDSLLSGYISETNDEARIEVDQFRDMLIAGNYESGNLGKELLPKLLWYETVFNNDKVVVPNMEYFYNFVQDWETVSRSKLVDDAFVLKYNKEFTVDQLINIVFSYNLVTEEFILKHEDIFPKGLGFKDALKHKRNVKVFSKDFMKKTKMLDDSYRNFQKMFH